jgi:hypothetical protein
MEIDSTDGTLTLVEANIVEAFETGTSYRPYTMVWHQKVLLPSHENILSLRQPMDMAVAFARLLLKRPESIELCPVLQIDLIGGAPIFMLG